MLNLGISLMVQDLGVCPPMRGHQFDPWSRKIPHAMGQLNPCCTTTEASTLECMLSIKRSQHNGKPKLCSSKESAQSKKRKTSKKKVRLNLDAFLNHVAHIPWKEKSRKYFGGGAGRWGSLLLNHPHDLVISALWLKNQYFISSPATNNNLASIHGHTQSDMRKKPANQEYSIQKVMFQIWRRNKNLPRESRTEGVPHH